MLHLKALSDLCYKGKFSTFSSSNVLLFCIKRGTPAFSIPLSRKVPVTILSLTFKFRKTCKNVALIA
jgi:hypothetical protein